MALVQLQNVTKTYQADGRSVYAVSGVSVEIAAGDFLSIVGHSGSGKTTLLSLIGGIIRPTSGRILFDGTDLATLGSDQISEYRSLSIGFMFQFASLLPMLTVRENMLLPVIFNPRRGRSEQKKVEDLLQMVGLTDKVNAYPAQLS